MAEIFSVLCPVKQNFQILSLIAEIFSAPRAWPLKILALQHDQKISAYRA
jgi:hypothetical protein